MSFSFKWNLTAINPYTEELGFILLKWNEKEVQKFEDLVDINLNRLSINPEIGIFNKKYKLYCLVISKQTTLYYSFNTEKKVIELHVFWNNLKNPEDLEKLL
jgi:hypothetical protein